ncbi:hypothetical protein [Candidatus Harpocratesius sp.]
MLNKNRKKITEKISQLPKGENSPSGKYWCLTCKKLFVLDKAECPYMTKMCVNTPISIEQKPPESTICLERFGLFYPKFPLRLMNLALIHFLDGMDEVQKAKKLEDIGEELVKTYISFLDEWKIEYKNEPLQTIKSPLAHL